MRLRVGPVVLRHDIVYIASPIERVYIERDTSFHLYRERARYNFPLISLIRE